jgi:hypothetical protein
MADVAKALGYSNTVGNTITCQAIAQTLLSGMRHASNDHELPRDH